MISFAHYQKLKWASLAVMTAGMIALPWFYDQINIWLTFFLFLFFTYVGYNIGLHRYFCHNTFKTGPIRHFILSFAAVFGLAGSPAVWAAWHIRHHLYSDQDKDPYPPSVPWYKGMLGIYDNQRWEYISLIVGKLILKNRTHNILHVYYMDIVLLTYLIVGVINPLWLVYYLIIPAGLSYMIANYFNAVIHIFNHEEPHTGYRNFDTSDKSRNHWILAILTLGGGEAWHNNHHAHPEWWYQGHRWWEFDISGWIIKLFFKRS